MLFTCNFTHADENADTVYATIEDICNPTLDDYKKIEYFLNVGKRKFLPTIDNKQYSNKSKVFRLTPKNGSGHIMTHEIIPINCSIEDKENCIILYGSCNFLYPQSILTLVNILKESSFKGHIIYRIGGWPNVEGGDLNLAHIPYSFKVCAFNEAYRLGFKRALWLDAPVRPHTDLNNLFLKIEKDGFFTYKVDASLANLCSDDSHYKALHTTKYKAYQTYTITAGFLGIDFTHMKGLKVFKEWYDVTKYFEKASNTNWVETAVLSVILNKYYKQNSFANWKIHTKCPQSASIGGNNASGEDLHFSYDKYDVEPDWPNHYE